MEVRLRLTRRRVVLLVALAAAIGAGVAYAAIPDGSGVFTACRLNNVGTIRLIDPTALPASSLLNHCTNLETQISWNQGGPTGPKGPPGDKGLPGDKGPTGNPGLPGDKGVPGDKGLPGDKGPIGDPGAAGDKGVPGDKGLPGDPGGQGLAGDKGPTGDKGQQGDPGPAGSADISGWEAGFTQSGVINPHTSATTLSFCPAGKKALGGGFDLSSPDIHVQVSRPSFLGNAWIVDANNDGDAGATLYVWVTCANG